MEYQAGRLSAASILATLAATAAAADAAAAPSDANSAGGGAGGAAASASSEPLDEEGSGDGEGEEGDSDDGGGCDNGAHVAGPASPAALLRGVTSQLASAGISADVTGAPTSHTDDVSGTTTLASPSITAGGTGGRGDGGGFTLPPGGVMIRHMTRLRVRLVARMESIPIEFDAEILSIEQ